MRLSLAMIVKDEADHLPHCLASVQGLVDEVVILDTGSTDATPRLAQAAGAKVLPFPWVHDFSAARNASIRACTGDWVLVLDADEAIDALDHGTIRRALESPQIRAYRLPLRNYLRSGAFMGPHRPVQANDGRYTEGAQYSHLDLSQHIRLFRRPPMDLYEGRIHELPDETLARAGWAVADLDATIHHFGKVDFERDLKKQREYLRLAKEEALRRPSDPHVHWNILQEALLVEDWPAALNAAEQYLKLRTAAAPMVYLGAAMALLAMNQASEALPFFEPILRVDPHHAPALTLHAEALWKLGRTAEAQDEFASAMAAAPQYTLSFLKASQMMVSLGQGALARQILEAGLDQNPKDLRLWEALVAHSARLETERAPGDAWDALQAVPDGGQTIWHQIVIQALLAREDPEGARHVLDLGLKAFPNHPELLKLLATV